MTVNDGQLLTKARTFDEQALAEIYDRWSEPIYRYALRMLGETDLAEECLSETFSRFLVALKNNKGPDNHLQAYLFRIAHNWITDSYRRPAPPSLPLSEEWMAAPEDEPTQVVAENMEKQQLLAALSNLTPDQRQVITLKYIEGWNTAEIARATGKPVGATKSLQHRALETLRGVLVDKQEKQ